MIFKGRILKNILITVWILLLVADLSAQSTVQQIQKAFQQFEDDSQLKYAISSLYVIDAKTGRVVFDKNSRVGLAPASTQKIITSVTAFEILGKDFRYLTEFDLADLKGDQKYELQIWGTGDPTFGSWRFSSTRDTSIIRKFSQVIGSRKIADVIFIGGMQGTTPVPEGYMWQDMGNYYGSGHFMVNWKENQYDVSFQSGNEGEQTRIVEIGLDTTRYKIINEVKSGPPGSGDNAYIYAAPYSKIIYLRGTVPPNQKSFAISGSDPNPELSFSNSLETYLKKMSIVDKRNKPAADLKEYQHFSPTLDSIIFWFNKKSINLYGEALLKTMAWYDKDEDLKKGLRYSRKSHDGSIDSGVVVLQRFWKEKGIDENELNISDGSGLSPINRVTTHAQVEILKYARNREWFSYFYNALPEYNGMKMKSGTIRDVKGFCGYQKSKDGNEYIFSFLVNNYNGPASGLVNKMYKVLDVLK